MLKILIVEDDKEYVEKYETIINDIIPILINLTE